MTTGNIFHLKDGFMKPKRDVRKNSNMIQKLRFKMIVTTMTVLLLMFISVFATLNLFMWSTSRQQTEQLLAQIIENDGMRGPILIVRSGEIRSDEEYFSQSNVQSDEYGNVHRTFPGKETPPRLNAIFRAGRFFYVKVDHKGKPLEVRHEMMFDFTDEEAMQYASQAIARQRAKGTLGEFQFMKEKKEYGSILVFAQRSIETTLLTRLIRVSLWAAGSTGLALFLFTLLFSRWAVAPVQTAFEKQRRFISDASHELKTPLTILNANADLLVQDMGESQHLQTIQEQAERLRRLIHDLLTLARADEEAAQTNFSRVDLSQTILSTALAFESRAFEEQRTYEIDIAPDIYLQGDAEQLKRLVSILIDNALNHSEEGGTVRVTLESREKTILSVYNTGEGIAEGEREKIFERFYRSDLSRARSSGGYGLGLAIAKSIAEAHKGNIMVESKEGTWARFIVHLRCG